MSELYIPIVLFIIVGIVAGMYLYFNYKSKLESQKTMRLAIEKGDMISLDTIEPMLSKGKDPLVDLKRGVLLISLALAFAAYGLIAQQGDLDIIGLSFFPLALGIAFSLMWKFSK